MNNTKSKAAKLVEALLENEDEEGTHIIDITSEDYPEYPQFHGKQVKMQSGHNREDGGMTVSFVDGTPMTRDDINFAREFEDCADIPRGWDRKGVYVDDGKIQFDYEADYESREEMEQEEMERREEEEMEEEKSEEVPSKTTVDNQAARYALATPSDLLIAYQLDTGGMWAINAGQDPSVPSNWSLIGKFNTRTGNVEE